MIRTGKLSVALPPKEAFRLFTPLGEREWVDHWEPHFPDPVEDDSAPGTVFQTTGHGGTTTWVVVDREPGRRVRYARIAQGTAGTVEVVLDEAEGGSEVTVTYELTALTEDARPELAGFAEHYPEFLREWHDAIARIT
ncbi:SRPBCC domain-containing protein [Phytohabitans houttuyneae]|uniref:Activator of Hsp90 ATPase homologue 1/2-like C-terminal domain-containing protein n=1 Tax=Phytohabitans houttuyneae TaxID=1076126 RepID=A0A6V8K421_9ACTN|nr:SRPBCC family protein [Phytohabitans houttuyneae]GFJ78280.1 hypothetical protein Phou_024600 [Phytohabitans houttuyneae]